MKRPWRLLPLVLLAASYAGCRTTPSPRAERHEFQRVEMGMPVRLVLHTEDPARGRLAAKTAFDRIRALNRILSDYEDDSEINRLRASAGSGECL
jgi:thiamine biosynthesis lipoprotein